MTPSNRWFATSLQDRAAWYQNFSFNFSGVALSLGFTAGDISSVGDDAEAMLFLADTALKVEAYASAATQYRRIITQGNIGEPKPAFPDPLVLPAAPGVTTGIFERLDDLVKRIRVAPNYTDEIGALLGILVSPIEPGPVDEIQPEIKALSMPGSVVRVSFVRGKSDGVLIETKIDKANWAETGRYFKSPADITIPENSENLPRAVQVRARFIDGNTPVGQFSPVVSTSTQPDS